MPRHASLFVLTFLSLPGLLACNGDAAPAREPRPVIVQTVQPEPLNGRDSYHGEIHARHETTLSFRTGGKLLERAVELGETVREGQLLARLDAEDARLAAEAAAAAYRAARDRRDLARLEFERVREIRAQGLVSQSVFDARKAEYDVAEAQLREARKQYELRRNQLAYTELRADTGGVITAVLAEEGQVLAAGQAVFQFARAGEREVWIDVPESRVGELAPGQAAVVELWAQPGRQYAGTVREIAADADPATRTYRVRVALQAPDEALRLGMSATVRLREASTGTAVRLPLTSLYHLDNRPAVWVFDAKAGSVKLREVDVLRYTEDAVLIGAGLEAGEQVVVRGAHKLHEGQKVRAQAPLQAAEGRRA